MNKQAVAEQRGYFQMVHGVTLKLIGTFAEADLDYRPKEGMRTVRDLMSHMYGLERVLAESVCLGKMTQEASDRSVPETEPGKAAAAQLTSIAKCVEFAKEAHQYADEVAARLTDDSVAKSIDTPFGAFTAGQIFGFAYDEHWHHRGQLYVFARLLGRNPPMLYAYEH